MSARCDLTELPVTDCACRNCRNLPDPIVEEKGELGPWFAARFEGRCAGCEERFDGGDPIRADGTGYGYLAECCGVQS